MKKFLGLTWEEAIEEAKRQEREITIHEADEWSDAWIEVSTEWGNGAGLEFENGICVEYEFLDWA